MNSKVKGKSKILAIICFIFLIMFLTYVLLKNFESPTWVNFYEHEIYNGFFDDNIKEIVLQKSINTKVTFSDEDLVEIWEKFFRTLQIRKESRKPIFVGRIFGNVTVGGGRYVEVITEKSKYLFSFRIPLDENDLKLEIGNYYYGFISNEENPFDDTYNIAKGRHGEINFWK